MNIDRLQDRIAMGLGVAARKTGGSCAVYRPTGIDQPLREHNRVIELFASFQPAGHGTSGGRDAAIWLATYDSHYTSEGDYLVGNQGTFFVAMQRPALPIKCVLTNVNVSILRPSFAAQGGYNGLYTTGGTLIINSWPGCFIASENSVSAGAGPVLITTRTLLLPQLPAAIHVADLVTDDTGASYAVVSSEQNAMGWRLVTRTGTP